MAGRASIGSTNASSTMLRTCVAFRSADEVLGITTLTGKLGVRRMHRSRRGCLEAAWRTRGAWMEILIRDQTRAGAGHRPAPPPDGRPLPPARPTGPAGFQSVL